ncbi:MAG: arylamine N-acetyltransferase, partial [Bradyrhizobium sp.]|nr:arylamine N-acetyltransferase [Bradyrhizobium sp.]
VPATHTLMMERAARGVRDKLGSRRYTRQDGDAEVIEERALASAAELGHVIDDIFRVTPPVPIEDLWERTTS